MPRVNKKPAGSDNAVIMQSPKELADIVSSLQMAGKTIVFTNGTFDLLHVGHTRCLKDARSRGDYLIVGVNSDTSVKKYKHAKLPIQPLEDRMEVLSSLRWVDYILSFDEETADEIIGVLKPDLVAKGTDYKPEKVPERETIESYGGKIVICGDPKNHATRKIIQRIRRLKM